MLLDEVLSVQPENLTRYRRVGFFLGYLNGGAATTLVGIKIRRVQSLEKTCLSLSLCLSRTTGDIILLTSPYTLSGVNEDVYCSKNNAVMAGYLFWHHLERRKRLFVASA